MNMSGKRKKKLNRSHPDCAKYLERFEALWGAYTAKEQAEKAKYPDWDGKDHPANPKFQEEYRRLCKEIQELQKEYDYLFVDEAKGRE